MNNRTTQLCNLAAVTSVALLGCGNAFANPLGDCSLEPDLDGRSDVVLCEPWESETWWADHGYVRDGGKAVVSPVKVEQMEYTSLITDGCLSGQCMQVETPVGVTRSLSIHWPFAAVSMAPDEAYFRYHFKIGSAWTADMCSSPGNTVWPPAGKFWGFGDPRINTDPGGQCGNGGAQSNGVDCWSARGNFQGCADGYSDNNFPYDSTCEETPNAKLRLGSYLYLPDTGGTHGAVGLWDNVAERNSMGDDYTSSCRRDDPNDPDPDCYCNSSNNMYCGLGTGGQLVADQWYAIETYVKMNTPGVADGIIRGWVDDVLAYEKTNVVFRKPGHDDLHIRTLWLDTYKGGTYGNCEDSAFYYDQLVIATERIGAFDTGPRPNPPSNWGPSSGR